MGERPTLWLGVQTSTVFFFLKKYIYLFYLTLPGLSCGMWHVVPQPGIEPRTSALGVQSLSHWTTREVPDTIFSSLWLIILSAPTTDSIGRGWSLGVRGDIWMRARGLRGRG